MWRSIPAIFAVMHLGCGTIAHGTSQTISLSSTPPGAHVIVHPGNIEVITPAEVELNRRNTYAIQFRKKGYADQSASVAMGPSWWLLADIPLLLFPAMIDMATGGGYSLDPSEIHVHLEALATND